jgi:hypothetical protein
MKKFYVFLAFIPVITFLLTATYFYSYKEPVSQFQEGSVFFKEKIARSINLNFYPASKAFWILDTINSFDCSRIEKAIEESADDEPLKRYFEVHLEVCKYEVESGNRYELTKIQSGPFVPEEFYKDYYDGYLGLFPKGTSFDNVKDYA